VWIVMIKSLRSYYIKSFCIKKFLTLMKFRIPYIFWISAGWPTLTIITYDLISYRQLWEPVKFKTIVVSLSSSLYYLLVVDNLINSRLHESYSN
jgi:hypothetical protein